MHQLLALSFWLLEQTPGNIAALGLVESDFFIFRSFRIMDLGWQ